MNINIRRHSSGGRGKGQKEAPWSFVRMLGALLMLLVLANYHHNVMQGVAWGGMAVIYSQESGLEEGLKRTLAGDELCSLCVAIESSRGTLPDEKEGFSENGPKREVFFSQVIVPHAPFSIVKGARLEGVIIASLGLDPARPPTLPPEWIS